MSTLPKIFMTGALMALSACGEDPKPAEPKPVINSPVTIPPDEPGERAMRPDDIPPPVEEPPPELPSWYPPLVDEGDPPQLADETLSADQLVTLGKRYYRKERWQPAAQLFVEATRREQDHAEAHYQLARAKNRQRRAEGPCQHDALMSTVLLHLQLAAELDAELKTEASRDPDLEEARSHVWYRVIQGADLSDVATVKQLATESAWFKTKDGAMSPTVQLAFSPLGSMTQKVGGADAVGRFVKQPGSWKPAPNALMIDFGDGTKQRAELKPRGDLVLDGRVAWTNLPGECGA